MERIELLAPAKDLETGQAAINCGADAVYIGATRFGAREAAGNSLADLEQLIAYAHKYWASVYVTVNTLLHDEELPPAERLIRQLYQMGADALIIQDAGLLELDLPPIPLFASTQMHNHAPERVAFLGQVGFQRAILARELSLEQIRTLRAASSIELETFIHGALCVSYSGQCYMSYALGGRSGNRGQCAQPCRRRYSLLDRSGSVLLRDRYLLSLRDLNLSAYVADLIAAGVCSFKIEGRLKDKAYVMNVVGHYRQLLDQVLTAGGQRPASSGRCQFDFTPDLNKTFNRGYTSYFLRGRNKTLASPDTPKSLGELLGKVVALDRRSFRLEDGAPAVHPGDGVCFFDAGRELHGTPVNEVRGADIFPERIEGLVNGAAVYRNYDHDFVAALQKSKTGRKLRVDFHLRPHAGGLCLQATDEDGVQAESVVELQLTLAEKPEPARLNIQRQLCKLGGTDFEAGQVTIDLTPMYFVPLGVLNQLRRDAVEQLAAARQQARPRPRRILPPDRDTARYPEKQLSYLGNVLNAKARAFYYRHGVEYIEPAAESGLDLRGRRVMITKYCLKYQYGMCPRQAAGSTQPWPEPLALVDEEGNRFPLRFNCAECVMEIDYGGKGETPRYS